MKYCPFRINGPYYQRLYGANSGMARIANGFDKINTMQDWQKSIDPAAPDYIMMPMVRFQAELHYRRLSDGRILMLDAYDRTWSVFSSSADEVLPAMQKGVLNAWWTMAKKGKAYGLMVDLKQPLLANVPANLDIPQMLEKVQDLNTVMTEFEAMAV